MEVEYNGRMYRVDANGVQVGIYRHPRRASRYASSSFRVRFHWRKLKPGPVRTHIQRLYELSTVTH